MQDILKIIKNKAKEKQRTIIIPEGDDDRVIQATKMIYDEKIAKIILIGDPKKIHKKAKGQTVKK